MNMSININNVNANSGVRQVTKNIVAALLLAAGCASAMANVLPQVRILSVESNGAAPATIKLDAEATDSDGSIAKVEFFSGTTLIGTATEAPFNVTWTGAATGLYSVTAKATDNLGASSVTFATSIVVGSSSAQAYYIHSDQIDTARLITNDAGQAVWKSDFEPFGASPPDENPQAQGPFVYNNRFPGQYFDRETGLHYNYYRDYDPQTGRYIQSDPIGLEGGINTYAYVSGNPVSLSDPSGLHPYMPIHRVPKAEPSEHNYVWRVFRCMGDCREQAMKDLLCNPAPGVNPNTPTKSGDMNNVHLGPMTLGPIVTGVDPYNNTTFNLTMPGHILHPGWARRDVVFDGAATWIETTGGGTGLNPLNLNTILAPIVWGGQNPSKSSPKGCGCEK